MVIDRLKTQARQYRIPLSHGGRECPRYKDYAWLTGRKAEEGGIRGNEFREYNPGKKVPGKELALSRSA
ncbi:hypothetical protein DZS_43500 [Dickeya ananatis]